MPDILRIGLSALLAQQRALSTTANNIANANTPGYSRQRLEFSERPMERFGGGYIGSGVDVGLIRRISDTFLVTQLQSAEAAFERSEAFARLASTIDDLLADSRLGITARFQGFRDAIQDLGNDPGSTAARQVLLSEGRQLISMLQNFDSRLDEVSRQVGSETSAAVLEINALGRAIADLNLQALSVGTNGQPPADLADQRDALIQQLAGLVRVQTVAQDDGTVSVFIGSGQSLVIGTASSELAVENGQFGPQQQDIVLQASGGNLTITSLVTGGKLGGLLDFRREMLEPVRNEIGLFAVGLVDSFNATHREGMDLNGQLGGDFFSIAGPVAIAAAGNGGGASASVVIEDVGALQPSSYQLSYDGANYQLIDVATGALVPTTGTGSVADPLRANGLAIVVTGAPIAGDRFLVEPLAQVAGTVALSITDPAAVAAAAPIRTRASTGNGSAATISAGEVADITDPGLLTTTTIEFLTASTYSINGAGSFAYTSGADIVVNGARVQISGTPSVGDQFIIESNSGGVGDNRNALSLADTLAAGLFDGGVASLQDAVSQLVTAVGAQTAEVSYQRDAQDALRVRAEQSLQSVRGVNLDEEAARMLEQEQMYQAAAKTIAVADLLFQSLIAAIRS
ncbi:MAG: flagellar hook-associated protein FlgK [Gammaproteobacteria bacterium]|nr:flagellar hook-associated protein FlgK [Gammaproteobacteria bacterium]